MARLSLSALCAFICALVLATGPALAREGDVGHRETRVSGTCGTGATATLRLRSRDGIIEAEFELNRRRRAGESWRVAVVHERRVAWRHDIRTRRSAGSLRVRITLTDLAGPDQITVRASGPGGITCETSATLPG